jgi:hypothetical protein
VPICNSSPRRSPPQSLALALPVIRGGAPAHPSGGGSSVHRSSVSSSPFPDLSAQPRLPLPGATPSHLVHDVDRGSMLAALGVSGGQDKVRVSFSFSPSLSLSGADASSSEHFFLLICRRARFVVCGKDPANKHVAMCVLCFTDKMVPHMIP